MDRLIIDGMAFAWPLFIMAIGGIYCERSGITNLALEGFQGFGAFIGALSFMLFQNFLPADSLALYLLAFLFAFIGGGIYSLLHALLCIRFKANQVISGVVINILAMALTAFLTKAINRAAFGAASDKFVLSVSHKVTIPGISEIPVIGWFFKNMDVFSIIIIILAILFWYILYHTKYGMDLRACGDNPHAYDAAGGNVSRVRLIAVMVSGALSGIAGMSFAFYISANFSSSIYSGYGYLAIAGLIFGNWNILTAFGACILFGLARQGGYMLVQAMDMPSTYSDLVMILPYVLTLILLLFFSKYNRAPRALGEIYDKGKR